MSKSYSKNGTVKYSQKFLDNAKKFATEVLKKLLLREQFKEQLKKLVI